MPGVTIEGILQVNDEGGSGPGVDVNITGPIGSQPSADSVSVTLASDEPPIHVIVDSSPPVGVTNDGTFVKETGGHLESIDDKLVQDQQLAANSLSVVIASDQSPIPVSGSFTPGSNTATGTLSTNSGAGSTLEIDTEGMNTVAGYNSAQAGGFSESLSVQGQVSGSTDWFAIPYLQFDSGTATNRLSGLVPAATVFFQVNCAAFSKVRLLRFASSTGTTTWFLASTPATIDSIQQVLLMSSNGQNISSTNGHLDVEVQGTANVQATNLDIRDLLFATDKVDVTGSTVSITGSVAVTNAGLTNLDVALSTVATADNQTNGSQKSIVRGGAKGATVAADVTSTAQSADRQGLDVQIRTSSGAAVDSFGGTSPPTSSTTTRIPPAWRQTITLLAANASRKEAQIVNGTNAPMYLYEGAGASDVTYTDIVPPRAKYILDEQTIITGFWNQLPTDGWVFATDRQ